MTTDDTATADGGRGEDTPRWVVAFLLVLVVLLLLVLVAIVTGGHGPMVHGP